MTPKTPKGPDAPKNRAQRVTLTQVAERAGVSRAAAGFVMNGRTDQRISSATFARVRKAAEELDYRPNIIAKTLRTGKSGTVALVSDFVSSTSFANSMVLGALRQLRERDGLLFAVDTQGDPEVEKRVLQNLLDRQVDGVIYASMFTRIVAVPELLRSTPLVLLNCLDDLGTTAVLPDEVEAGATAAQLLVDAGHRDEIYFIGTFSPGTVGGAAWPDWSPVALPRRLAGIDARLADHGLQLAGRVEITTDWDVANGDRAIRNLLDSGARPKALICVNDAVAVGAMKALRAKGFSVPSDVSVVSFDGSPLTDAVDPTLTSIALPQEELGRRAVALLFDPAAPPGIRLVDMPVVQGGSISVPARGRNPA